jgi:uncharacterized membrane protein YdbT with pleckstrin-like domain
MPEWYFIYGNGNTAYAKGMKLKRPRNIAKLYVIVCVAASGLLVLLGLLFFGSAQCPEATSTTAGAEATCDEGASLGLLLVLLLAAAVLLFGLIVAFLIRYGQKHQ